MTTPTPEQPPTLTSMLEDLETHAEHPAAVLAIVSDLRALLGLPDERLQALIHMEAIHAEEAEEWKP